MTDYPSPPPPGDYPPARPARVRAFIVDHLPAAVVVAIGFGKSVVRQLAHVVDTVSYVGYLVPLWDLKRQTLADKIMSTVCLPDR